MRNRGAVTGVALIMAAATAAQVRAQPPSRWQVFAGGEDDSARFGYVGGSYSFLDEGNGHGPEIRASGFTGAYDYTGGPANGRVRATFSGAEVDALYQFSGPSYWMNVGVGARYANTRLSPFDPGNHRHGAQVEAAPDIDGGVVRGPWRVDYYGSYGTRLEDYTVRASLTHAVGWGVRLGGEATFEGDPTYNLQRIGPYGAVQFDRRSELLLSAGYSHQSGRADGAYVRVGINRSF